MPLPIYVRNRRLSGQLHQLVVPLIYSYLHRELSIYLKRPLCSWFITAFHLHVAVRHLSDTQNQADLQWHYLQCVSGRQAVTRASGCLIFCLLRINRRPYSRLSDIWKKNTEQMSDRDDSSQNLFYSQTNVIHNLSCYYLNDHRKWRQQVVNWKQTSVDKKVMGSIKPTTTSLTH